MIGSTFSQRVQSPQLFAPKPSREKSATTILAPDYFEAPFVHKKDGIYYYSYSTTFQDHPPYIDYMTSDNPMSGWEYRGIILKSPGHNRDNNNHHSIVGFEGSWYLFYHNRVLSYREGLNRISALYYAGPSHV
jgi:arabinoxylan arabinofuranohydrolase